MQRASKPRPQSHEQGSVDRHPLLQPRVVNLLDRRPGQPLDDRTRVVNGIELERGILVPPRVNGNKRITETLRAMEVGESFTHCHPCKDATRLVKTEGTKEFTSRQIEDKPRKFRIWRVK